MIAAMITPPTVPTRLLRPAIAVGCCACAAVTRSATAQAGGGGSFGSGGGGGDLEGIGYIIELLIRFTIHYPQYGIPIWIIIGVVFYFVKREEKSFRVSRTIRKGRKRQEQGLRDAALADIAQRDHGFSTKLFLERSSQGFLETQHAWSEQELSRCRAFISDGVHERFALYVSMQQTEQIRNRMRDVHISSTKIVAVTSDVHFDTIHVRFVAQAITYDESLKSGKRVGGASQSIPTEFSEIWSFSRRTGVETKPRAALVQGTCPNCGGSLDIIDVAQCAHCESVVNSGQYDWVLAEITQAEEWVVPPAAHLVDGWDALREVDPALSFQHLEDRASVMFWRCMMAVYFDDIAYATPIMSRERVDLPSSWSLPAERFWKTPAVGTVEVVRVLPANPNDGYDRIHVLVRWSARRAEGDRHMARDLDRQRIYSHVLVLKRRAGVSTKIEQAFASFNCNSCGAPVEIGRSAVCKFCDSILNDGARDWVLEEVLQYSTAQELQREDRLDAVANRGPGVERLEDDRFVNEPELLGALARIVLADGLLHAKERKYLKKLANRRGVCDARLNEIVRAAGASEQPIMLPDNEDEANVFVNHLVRAALVDGRITRSERKLLTRAVAKFGWSEERLNKTIARNRDELYRQAKTILRRRKR